MKADPTKYNLTGAKKKKSPSIADRAYGAVTRVGKVAKSFNEAVLPIKEVKRIAKGKGSKGDYAYTALSALPLIGRTPTAARAATRIAAEVRAAKVPTAAAKVKQTAKINQNLRNQNTIKRATERAETVKYRNANRPRPMSGPAAKRVEFESKALQKRQARIEKLDKTTVRRMNTPTVKGRIKASTESRRLRK